MSPRRRFQMSLLLGVLTTIAIAWLPALEALRPDATLRIGKLRSSAQARVLYDTAATTPPKYWVLYRNQFPLQTAITIHGPLTPWNADTQPVTDQVEQFATLGREIGDLNAELQQWRNQPAPAARGLFQSAPSREYGWYASGWPMRALCKQGWSTTMTQHQVSLHQGWAAHIETTPGSAGTIRFNPDIIFPLHPLWIGFTVDTLLAAALWMIPLSIPRWIKSSRRRRRGLCTRCAYDRSTLTAQTPCPECGQPPDPNAINTEQDRTQR